MNIGLKIRQLRRRAGMTQVEFADRIGVTSITVSKWENARQMPSLNRIATLERVLGADSSDQMVGEGVLISQEQWPDSTGVTAVVTGVVMSLKTGVSLPVNGETGVNSSQPLQNAPIEGPAHCHGASSGRGPGPDFQLQQGAGDAVGRTEDDARFMTDPAASDPSELGQRCRGGHCDSNGVGELIDFNPHDPGEHPELSGIYVLYDICGRPLYVGQGKSIDKRIRNHHDKFWFRSPIVETASYVQIDDKVLRERVEAVLIKFLKGNAVINKKLVDR